ncbi:rubredoxin-like domain-containing protein [Barnesiella intestinihominis]|uniref:rubredoxin-like domain-containing protein n=1 Tax=Barnesiella intestinihominis TaxID=487174 RepID=UPI003967A404
MKEENVSPEDPKPNSGKKYICEVCGYIHEGELPDDFKCPVCQAPRSCFKEI